MYPLFGADGCCVCDAKPVTNLHLAYTVLTAALVCLLRVLMHVRALIIYMPCMAGLKKQLAEATCPERCQACMHMGGVPDGVLMHSCDDGLDIEGVCLFKRPQTQHVLAAMREGGRQRLWRLTAQTH